MKGRPGVGARHLESCQASATIYESGNRIGWYSASEIYRGLLIGKCNDRTPTRKKSPVFSGGSFSRELSSMIYGCPRSGSVTRGRYQSENKIYRYISAARRAYSRCAQREETVLCLGIANTCGLCLSAAATWKMDPSVGQVCSDCFTTAPPQSEKQDSLLFPVGERVCLVDKAEGLDDKYIPLRSSCHLLLQVSI